LCTSDSKSICASQEQLGFAAATAAATAAADVALAPLDGCFLDLEGKRDLAYFVSTRISLR